MCWRLKKRVPRDKAARNDKLCGRFGMTRLTGTRNDNLLRCLTFWGNKKRGLGGRVCFFYLQFYYSIQQWGIVTFLQKYIVRGISEMGRIGGGLPLDKKIPGIEIGRCGSRCARPDGECPSHANKSSFARWTAGGGCPHMRSQTKIPRDGAARNDNSKWVTGIRGLRIWPAPCLRW